MEFECELLILCQTSKEQLRRHGNLLGIISVCQVTNKGVFLYAIAQPSYAENIANCLKYDYATLTNKYYYPRKV